MTNLPPSSCESSSFGLLDRRIQRWIWSEGWTTLRDIQELAIPALINADGDVIISAATASGKTEAAFFPILSHLLQEDEIRGAVLYVSPLKALINDQWGRLQQLCESLEVPVIPWHGDISASRKHRFLKEPRGILLITPESLEALFVNRGTSMPTITEALTYLVVDELHSFIGAERGKQLQSLLHRVEKSAGRCISRVGLSATLGNMQLAAEFLRPGSAPSVKLLNSTAAGQQLKVLVKCFEETRNSGASSNTIAQELFAALRGSNNLIFPNRRSQVELYTDLLRRLCEARGMPNEFWAHHGNLSRELREETEHALKSGSYAATAICTSTLELGIDIGSVKSIAQIDPPPSVASLRQRLGRSGRRAGEPAILRCYCTENALDSDSSLSDQLREGLTQTTAMIRLLVAGWFEPPDVNGLHASTFVQQALSVIAERGGATAGSLWSVLIQDGPFSTIDKESYFSVLKEMGNRKLIMQDATGLLLHGELGEKLVNSYDFYSAFVSEEEFSVQAEGHTLGSLPVSRPLVPDQRIIFGGRRWRVLFCDTNSKVISVVPDLGGVPPTFDSSGATVHDRVRSEMRAVLASSDPIPFIDESGRTLMSQAREAYRRAGLDRNRIVESGDGTLVFTWRGDKTNDALALILSSYGYSAWNEGLVVRIRKAEVAEVNNLLSRIALSSVEELATIPWPDSALIREKWDWALPRSVLEKSFSSSRLDIAQARQTAAELQNDSPSC